MPPGLTGKTAKQCLALIRYQLKPWEWDDLPLDMRRWLDPIARTIDDIENGR